MLRLLSQGSRIKLSPIKRNERQKKGWCEGRWNSGEREASVCQRPLYTECNGLKYKSSLVCLWSFIAHTDHHVHFCTAHQIFRFCFFTKHAAVTYQNGPGGLVIAITHSPGFGQLHFMTVDPTPQLMSQPANQIQSILSGLMWKEKGHQLISMLVCFHWYMKVFITYSKHFVLLTGGWQGGGGLRKIGSFTTIRALSSELQHRRKRRQRVIGDKSDNLTRLVRCSQINVRVS